MANKHIYILATLSNQKWSCTILYKTAKNCFATNLRLIMKQPLFSYITIACRIFVLNKWQGQLFTWLNIFSRPFSLLEYVVIFSTKPTGFFDVRAHWVPDKWPRALSYIHDSSSLACRNSYGVHHNVSNSLLPLTVFGRESCLKLCYPLE